MLAALEGEMKKIVKENLRIERFELPRAEAIALMTERDEPYKVQLINELPDDAVISFYGQASSSTSVPARTSFRPARSRPLS